MIDRVCDRCHSLPLFNCFPRLFFLFFFPVRKFFFIIFILTLRNESHNDYFFILLFQRTVWMNTYFTTSPLITTPLKFIGITKEQSEVSHKIITYIYRLDPMDGTLIWDWKGIWRFLVIIWLWMEFRTSILHIYTMDIW